MSKTNSEGPVNVPAHELYGNKVRARVCGICSSAEGLLLVNHFGLYGHDFWAPPGGGMEFGQSAAANLKREFRVETGLEVQVGKLRFVCEFIQEPLHAIELFFGVSQAGGILKSGHDPEMSSQIIKEVRFVSWKDLELLPGHHLHGALAHARTRHKIESLEGYLRI